MVILNLREAIEQLILKLFIILKYYSDCTPSYVKERII